MNYKRTAPETGASSENYSGASTVSTTARDYSTPIVIRWWEYPALLLRLVVIAAAIIVWAFAFEVGANINSAAFRFEVRQPLIELKRDIKDYRDKYHGESKDSYAKQKSDRSTW